MSVDRSIVLSPFAQQFIQTKSRQLCRRSGFSASDVDDVRQGMLLHLWTKAHLFDRSRGRLEAFVTTASKSWIGMELRRRGRAKRGSSRPLWSLDVTVIRSDAVTTPGALLLPDDRQRHLGRYGRPECDEPSSRELIASVFARTTPEERSLLIGVVDRGVAGAARASGRSRREIQRDLHAIRSRFGDFLENSCAAPGTAA